MDTTNLKIIIPQGIENQLKSLCDYLQKENKQYKMKWLRHKVLKFEVPTNKANFQEQQKHATFETNLKINFKSVDIESVVNWLFDSRRRNTTQSMK